MITCQSISKVYPSKNGLVQSLHNINLNIEKGEFIILRGPSGCGKSTLLFLLGGMLHPSSGEVFHQGENLYTMNDSERNSFRARQIGFIFQMFHLLPFLDVLENLSIAAPSSMNASETDSRVHEVLALLGLGDRQSHRPDQLSAGERQRVAIGRALLNSPDIILADEPTGNLDPDNAREVFENLSRIHKSGKTVIVVTHGAIGDEYATRVLHLNRGMLVADPSTQTT